MARSNRKTMGTGAVISILLKMIHPSKHIRDKFPNLSDKQRLEFHNQAIRTLYFDVSGFVPSSEKVLFCKFYFLTPKVVQLSIVTVCAVERSKSN